MVSYDKEALSWPLQCQCSHGAGVNAMESFWSQLKRMINGTHIHVSGKDLWKYAKEAEYRSIAGTIRALCSTSFCGLSGHRLDRLVEGFGVPFRLTLGFALSDKLFQLSLIASLPERGHLVATARMRSADRFRMATRSAVDCHTLTPDGASVAPSAKPRSLNELGHIGGVVTSVSAAERECSR
jgi:hypothetical protein